MATRFARKKKEDVSIVSFSPRPSLQRYFGYSSVIGNANQFSIAKNYPQTPLAPISIYYAQHNYQSSPSIYQNKSPFYKHTLPNHQANAPTYKNPGKNNPNSNKLPLPNLEIKPQRLSPLWQKHVPNTLSA